MAKTASPKQATEPIRPKRSRVDALRSNEALLEAALAVFTVSGVDAPVREIATKAGVGVGTVYRSFPQRSDLVIAVFRHQVDACAEAARVLASKHTPGEALSLWMRRYVEFLVAKRGLASALHSGDPAFQVLPVYFDEHLRPALQSLLEAAVAAGEVRRTLAPDELLRAVGSLAMSSQDGGPDLARRMVDLLVDGMRHGATRSA